LESQGLVKCARKKTPFMLRVLVMRAERVLKRTCEEHARFLERWFLERYQQELRDGFLTELAELLVAAGGIVEGAEKEAAKLKVFLADKVKVRVKVEVQLEAHLGELYSELRKLLVANGCMEHEQDWFEAGGGGTARPEGVGGGWKLQDPGAQAEQGGREAGMGGQGAEGQGLQAGGAGGEPAGQGGEAEAPEAR